VQEFAKHTNFSNSDYVENANICTCTSKDLASDHVYSWNDGRERI